MAEQRDVEQAVRAWLQTLERCVRQVDYGTARRMFADDVLSFGTRADVVSGLDRLVANQWSGIWPNIRDFTIEFDQLHWGASGGLAWAMVPWNSTGFHPDGTAFPRPGRATVIFERRDGKWLAIHTHFSLFPATPQTTHGVRESRDPFAPT
jgi:ketosteroid isomerase-like protein